MGKASSASRTNSQTCTINIKLTALCGHILSFFECMYQVRTPTKPQHDIAKICVTAQLCNRHVNT